MSHVHAEIAHPARPSSDSSAATSTRHWPHWLAGGLLTLVIGGVGATIESHRQRLPTGAPIVLLAPVTKGGVLERIKARGEVLAPASASDRRHLVAQVDESELGQLQAGQKVRFSVPAYQGRSFLGEIERLGSITLAADGVRRGAVEIAMGEGAGDLRAGMSAAVQIEVRSVPGAFRVPVAALQFSPDRVSADGVSPSLWLSEGTSLRRVPVEVRASDGTFVEIVAAGLSEGAGVAVGYARTRPERP